MLPCNPNPKKEKKMLAFNLTNISPHLFCIFHWRKFQPCKKRKEEEEERCNEKKEKALS